jgi:hypothetical protein
MRRESAFVLCLCHAYACHSETTRVKGLLGGGVLRDVAAGGAAMDFPQAS